MSFIMWVVFFVFRSFLFSFVLLLQFVKPFTTIDNHGFLFCSLKCMFLLKPIDVHLYTFSYFIQWSWRRTLLDINNKSLNTWIAGLDLHDIIYHGKCLISGALASSLTHLVITSFDVTKCNMKVNFVFISHERIFH